MADDEEDKRIADKLLDEIKKKLSNDAEMSKVILLLDGMAKPEATIMMTKEMTPDAAISANEDVMMSNEMTPDAASHANEDIMMTKEVTLDGAISANEDVMMPKEITPDAVFHDNVIMTKEVMLGAAFSANEDVIMTKEVTLDAAISANEDAIMTKEVMLDAAISANEVVMTKELLEIENNLTDQPIIDDEKIPDILSMAEKRAKMESMLDIVKNAEVASAMAEGKTSDGPLKKHIYGGQNVLYSHKSPYTAHSTVMSQPNNPSAVRSAFTFNSNSVSNVPMKGAPYHYIEKRGHYNNRYEKSSFVSHNPYGRGRQPQETGLGVKKLLELSKMYPEGILTTLKCDPIQLNNFLQNDPKPDQIVLFVKCLAALSSGHFEAAKLHVLIVVCQSKFIGVLQKYIMGQQYAELEDKARNKFFWDNSEDFYLNILKFSDSVIDLSPSTAVNTFRILFDSIKLSVDGLTSNHSVSFTEVFVNAFKQIQVKLTLCVEEERIKRSQSSRMSGESKEEQPPNDFRDISIMPSREDLFSPAVFLRPNIVDGTYNSVEHYLDVQFRLMREDFIAPLRESLKEYIHARNKKSYSGARFYKNASLLNYRLKAGVLVVEVCYESRAHHMQKMGTRMVNSKRFMHGSLLCLTPDDFKTVFFCTVQDRDDIAFGKIAVEMTCPPVDEMFGKSYLLVESETYFPPYLHVLKALQNPNMTREFPFEDYILGGKSSGAPPKYTNGVQRYVLRAENEHEEQERLVVTLADESTWPTPQMLGLDESQYNAYKMALNTEFVTIQGPPGTGKTFLGLMIATTILRNMYSGITIGEGWREHFCRRIIHRPILVVCFTNHALDQFLEGLLAVTRSLVRIGGQSKNKNLDQYNLNKLRRYNSQNYHLKQQLRQSSLAIEALQALLESLQSCKRVVDITHHQLTFIEPNSESKAVISIQDDRFFEIFFRNFVFGRRPPLLNWLLMTDRFCKHSQYYTDISEHYGYKFSYEIDIILTKSKDDFSFNMRLLEYSFQQLMYEVEEIEQDINNNTMDWKDVKILRRHIKHVLEEVNELKTRLLRGNSGYSEVAFGENSKAQAFNAEERWSLYWNWVDILKAKLREQHSVAIKKYQQHKVVFDELVQALDLRTLIEAHVVGVTTSGAARLQSLLKSLRSPIVIVEEAAEVMESHVVVSLTKDCQHLIMIGDHQQLRPKTATYQMGKKYNLDISLFERMVKNGSHCHQLVVQHRMRPEIARLITPAIYENLKNNANVEKYPDVKGATKNLFFIDHTLPETEVEDISSRSNCHEARFALKLAKYFIQQGYCPDEITILATYSGQMFLLRNESKHICELEKVNINILDNYQGEENKIIILSLVRSNPEGNIGFLATNNRVCVALSRAREGFYIIGNMNILVSKSPLWSTVNNTLKELDAIGPSLMLCCEIHKDLLTPVKSAEDFITVPEGGCSQVCGSVLSCGHICKSFCHPGDRSHTFTKCKEKCQRNICNLEHECPLICYEGCLPCKKVVRRTLICGHEANLECHIDYLTFEFCKHVFDVELPLCGHRAKRYCYEEIQDVKCQQPCKDRLACGHACVWKCHKNKDPDHVEYNCRKDCVRLNKDCTEDHKCPKQCFEPCSMCIVKVSKIRSCMHKSDVECGQDVNTSPCDQKCKRSLTCGHFCPRLCKDTCGGCKVKVEKQGPCGHTFKMSCSEEATVSLCPMKCLRTLPCGHPCPKLCQEPCTQSSCKTPVPNPFVSLCKHDFKIRCLKTLLDTRAGPILTMPYCSHPCGAILACGHTCKGTCGQCSGGRLHMSCEEPCGLTLVCGHSCEEPCREACPPCTKKCGVKCQHSECPLPCGIPCPPCAQLCQRKCIHRACTTLCGSECDIPVCSAACSQPQECGHACRGLCGELCPQICNVCQPQLFPGIFFGKEEDENAKFIKLVDCSHVVEVEGLDRWMEEKPDGQISVSSCPQCKTPIVNTPRYSNLVKRSRVKVEVVKKKVFGDGRENQQLIRNLFQRVLKLEMRSKNQMTQVPLWRRHLESLNKVMKHNVKLVQGKQVLRLSILEINKLSFAFETLNTIKDIYEQSNNPPSEIADLQATILLRAIMQEGGKILQPNFEELGNEICRLERIMDITNIEKHHSNETKVMESINNLKATVIFSLVPLDQEKNKAICNELNNLRKIMFMSPVTDTERRMVVKAMGFKQGHWYMCPNGHAYCITECGGAMVRSKCPDCGEVIGGERHTLVSTNKVATFMDGAKHGAWSDAANMNNYQLD